MAICSEFRLACGEMSSEFRILSTALAFGETAADYFRFSVLGSVAQGLMQKDIHVRGGLEAYGIFTTSIQFFEKRLYLCKNGIL